MTAVPHAAVQVHDLHLAIREHFWRPRRQVLRGVSFAVQPGEGVAFLGHNGAGKTTVLRVLLGLLRSDAGEAHLFGVPAGRPEARRGLGFLPERAYYPPQLSAVEFVVAHARLTGLGAHEAHARATRTLARVGLARDATRLLGSYSKGMLQRAGLAQALVARPRLLLLDEPLSGLDPVGRSELRALVSEERARGCSVVFCTHVLADAEAACGRAVVLSRGRVVVDERLRTLLAPRPGEPQPVRLHTTPLAPATLQQLQALVRAEPTGPDGHAHFVAADVACANAAVDVVRAAGAQVLALQPAQRTLDALFAKGTP